MTAKPETSPQEARIEALLDFWFAVDTQDAGSMELQMRRWFSSTEGEDRELGLRFGALAGEAAAGGLDELAGSPRGCLGLILLLDQLPRNLHRGSRAAFSGDTRSLLLCLTGMARRQHEALAPLEQVFYCMPLQHAEDRGLQAFAVETFAALALLPAPPPLAAALRSCADYAVAHREIVERFGRFPHRNRLLGRESTRAELEFLAAGGASFGQ